MKTIILSLLLALPAAAQDCITLEQGRANLESNGGEWLAETRGQFSDGTVVVYTEIDGMVFIITFVDGCYVPMPSLYAGEFVPEFGI